MKQLPLAIYLDDDATFANFYQDSNQLLIKHLQDISSGMTTQFTYIWGHVGSGRSHLLQACCNYAKQKNMLGMYIPLTEISNLSPKIMENLTECFLVCFDDINNIAGKQNWEQALFNSFNQLTDANIQILVAAESPPHHLPIILPDLHSRLASGITLQIKSLNDNQKIQAIILRAKNRGLNLPLSVAQYIFNHYKRDMHTLFNILEILDKESLVAKHRITIPFIKKIL